LFVASPDLGSRPRLPATLGLPCHAPRLYCPHVVGVDLDDLEDAKRDPVDPSGTATRLPISCGPSPRIRANKLIASPALPARITLPASPAFLRTR
jgi:hypothetical protein